MTYNELISRFEVFENPPLKEGYERHHIVPKSEQTTEDNRQIYCCPSMHMWLHILYDRENGTKTADWFLKLCGKPAEYFDCWEKCLAYSYTLRKKKEEGYKKSSKTHKNIEVRERISESTKEAMNKPDVKEKMSESHKGKTSWNKGITDCYSKETKQRMSESHIGRIPWNKGKKMLPATEETRQKLSDSHKGQKWFNNGVKCVRAHECPEGYVPGRLKS